LQATVAFGAYGKLFQQDESMSEKQQHAFMEKITTAMDSAALYPSKLCEGQVWS
jgi:hypothetical protein